MYKGSSQGLQRRYRVNKPLPTGGFIGDTCDPTDTLPSPLTLTQSQITAELNQLKTEKIRFEADLMVAKSRNQKTAIRDIGQKIQVICARQSAVKLRAHELSRISMEQALGDAIKELTSSELSIQIFNRAKEIQQELALNLGNEGSTDEGK